MRGARGTPVGSVGSLRGRAVTRAKEEPAKAGLLVNDNRQTPLHLASRVCGELTRKRCEFLGLCFPKMLLLKLFLHLC